MRSNSWLVCSAVIARYRNSPSSTGRGMSLSCSRDRATVRRGLDEKWVWAVQEIEEQSVEDWTRNEFELFDEEHRQTDKHVRDDGRHARLTHAHYPGHDDKAIVDIRLRPRFGAAPWWGWLGSRVVSVLDSGAEGTRFKSQPRRCWLGKLFTAIVPLFTKHQNW